MAWVIASNNSKEKRGRIISLNPQFQTLRWRLLGSYLLVMTTILVTSDVLVYQFFSRSLYQQLDQRLLNLAQAAAHSLTALKKNPQTLNQTKYLFDQDGDLDIPWQNLRQSNQSIEWFSPDKNRLAQSGAMIPNFPVQPGFQTFQQQKQFRAVTIIAYSYPQGQQTSEGFIRAIASSQEVEVVLQQLRWGCYLGGLTAVGLIGMGGMWLTRQSLKPIEQSYQQLKQFTADASHELRSPLTAIKTSVEVLQTHPERIHAADAGKLKAIVSATNQINHLVEDLLWLARTDTTIVDPSEEWIEIPLEELLEDVLEFWDLNAEMKDITLKFEEKTDIPVRGEPSQLSRLFSNLLDNAIKYTPKGGAVTLTLQAVDKFAVIGIGDRSIHCPASWGRDSRNESFRCWKLLSGISTDFWVNCCISINMLPDFDLTLQKLARGFLSFLPTSLPFNTNLLK
jgi:K+-sensing histidine kinase KdpD